MKKPSSLSAMVVSYVPLLFGDSMSSVEDPKEITEALLKIPDVETLACVWFIKDNKPFPIIVMKDMKKVLDHLNWWSEGKPTEWFDLNIAQRDGKYIIALIPRIKKSIERWDIAYQLRTGYPPPRDTKYSVMFRSITFVSGNGTVFDKISDQIGSEIKIGFVDDNDVNRNNISDIADDKIHTLGSFPINQDNSLYDYIMSMIDDAKDPGVPNIVSEVI